jgi:hypothetical protein
LGSRSRGRHPTITTLVLVITLPHTSHRKSARKIPPHLVYSRRHTKMTFHPCGTIPTCTRVHVTNACVCVFVYIYPCIYTAMCVCMYIHKIHLNQGMVNTALPPSSATEVALVERAGPSVQCEASYRNTISRPSFEAFVRTAGRADGH